MRIALDAMGGDYAPGPIVQGAIEAVTKNPGLSVALVGYQDRIEAELANYPDADLSRLPIVHASEVITMEDKPVEALRKKRDNSISKCWGLMAKGEVKAVVSAGNTGAMVASGMVSAKMFLPGVRRPGIAAMFPSKVGPVVLIDVGANMNAKPEDLYQYGVMGAMYARHVLKVEEPTIGLLNVGSEEDKGNDLTKGTRQLFLESPVANMYVGHIEGRDIYDGRARVVVCEGFTGNVLLKSAEGAVEFLFTALKQSAGGMLGGLPPEVGVKLKEGLVALKSKFEYQELGGAPLLGIQGACIICHGSSDSRAIANALRVACTMTEEHINDKIVEQLAASQFPAPQFAGV